MKTNGKILVLIFLVLIELGCTKQFLDAKPSTDIVQPVSIDELQKVLDHSVVINKGSGLGILSADEYIFSNDALWLSTPTATERNAYLWASDLYEGEICEHWNLPYASIFYANNVLERLEDISVADFDRTAWNNIKGSALFIRAFGHYELVQTFAKSYSEATADTDLGIPLRLAASIDVVQHRSSLKETYDKILSDLSEASRLLAPGLPAARSRPSLVAAHALFSRIYLSMRAYAKAEAHADTCLSMYSTLIDYNTLSKTSATPFVYNHAEQIYARTVPNLTLYSSSGNTSAANTYIEINPELLSLYGTNDLRQTIYFVKQTDGTYDLKRSYQGGGVYPFTGLATDEVYLIKAECLARRNATTEAMSKLDELLIKRWNPKATTPEKAFVKSTANSKDEAVDKIMLERRKELVFRGTRWEDIKRLNIEGANIILKRKINGVEYSILPNSPKYVFPIPDEEISLSGIQQNER